MYNETISKIEEYLESNQVNSIAKFDLDYIKETIIKTQDKIEIKKFELVFMGKSSVGKTTTISSILGMYFEDNEGRLVQVMHSDIGGRTTPCTIEIIPSDKTALEIIPVTKDELMGIISEFCYFTTGNKGNLPDEIRTMIKTKLKKETIDSIRSIKDVEAAKKIVTEELDIENIEIKPHELLCDEGDKNECFKWINTELSNLKKGKINNIIVPSLIRIYVKKHHINIADYIEKIVDTRGIGTESVKQGNSLNSRPELENYIKQNNTFVIYICCKMKNSKLLIRKI